MTSREEFKIKIGKNLLLSAGKEQRMFGQKRERGLLILKKWSNNPQLQTNSCASSEHLIIFKLFLPKSKRINLTFFATQLTLFSQLLLCFFD